MKKASKVSDGPETLLCLLHNEEGIEHSFEVLAPTVDAAVTATRHLMVLKEHLGPWQLYQWDPLDEELKKVHTEQPRRVILQKPHPN